MAIKNIFLFLVSLILTSLLISCDTFPLKTRSQINRPSSEQDSSSGDEDLPVSDVVEPEFIKQSGPKLGVILGPGGTLAYAHLGFLQELENNKIPIHAIAGVEWGALVGATYSAGYKAHGSEWKLLKLPVDRFSKKGLFTTSKQQISVTEFQPYINDLFGDKAIENQKVAFSCPYLNTQKGHMGVKAKGLLKNAILACWPSPPHFASQPLATHPLAVADIAKVMRQQGVEVIIYVDVLSRSRVLSSQDRKQKPSMSLFWNSQKRVGSLLTPPMVDQVVVLGLSGQSINSYQSLRSIIRTGQVKSKSVVKGMIKTYGY